MWRLALVALTACIEPALVPCADGRACPAGTACDDAHHGCVSPEQLDACTGAADLTPCATSHIPMGACFGGVCLPAGCGNGEVEPGELCDDGNLVSGDGCSADCRSQERCGDGYTDLTLGESCDDGNVSGRDGCTSVCSSENLTWRRQLGNVPPDVPAREAAAIVYDPVRRVTVAFGGTVAAGDLADTWEWNGSAWTEITPFVSPPARHDHALAYDPVRHRVVLFGGTSPLFGDLADTWELDGVTWERKTTAVAPPPRARTAMVWDPALKKIVMFGGKANTVGLDDFWAWDGRDWVQLDLPNHPLGRFAHSMTYDVANERVIVFGGVVASYPSTEAWAFDGTAWAQLSMVGGPVSFNTQGTVIYDPIRSVAVVIGCVSGSNGFEAQTWELSIAGWHQVTTIPPPLGPCVVLTGASYAYDIAHDQILEWGGNSFGYSNIVYVMSRGANPTWSTLPLPPTAHTPLHPHMFSALAYDVDRARTVLFGGEPYLGGTGTNETLEWDGSTWTYLGTGATPRLSHAMAWDGVSHRVIMFGGQGASALGDTWAWNGTSWSNVSPSMSPPPRVSPAMAYDSDRKRVVMFGGVGFADTWEWDGSAWHEVTPAIGSPAMMLAPMLAYDSRRKRTVMFGGMPNETWEWDGTAWAQMVTVERPEPRSSGAMVYNTARHRVVMIGGLNGTISEWEWDGTAWQRPAVASIVPFPVTGNSAAYDEARSEIVKIGGQGATGTYDTETWLGSYNGPNEEVCGSGHDVDGDGRIGCADEDCAAACAQCGDGICNGAENDRLCNDCPAPPPICGDAYCAPGETCAADCN